MPAGNAQPQMHPIILSPQALLASTSARDQRPNLIKMGTSLYHDFLSANDDLTLLLPATAKGFVELDQRQKLVTFRLRQIQFSAE